ncbi:MAG: hypothetical protein GXY37_03355 [Chloroflexi bacterium]|nr:hypothetical protein [Chloroflexota bacterium]
MSRAKRLFPNSNPQTFSTQKLAYRMLIREGARFFYPLICRADLMLRQEILKETSQNKKEG